MFDHSYLLNEYIPATMDHNSNQIIKLLVINSIVRLKLTQQEKSERLTNYCEKRNKQTVKLFHNLKLERLSTTSEIAVWR